MLLILPLFSPPNFPCGLQRYFVFFSRSHPASYFSCGWCLVVTLILLFQALILRTNITWPHFISCNLISLLLKSHSTWLENLSIHGPLVYWFNILARCLSGCRFEKLMFQAPLIFYRSDSSTPILEVPSIASSSLPGILLPPITLLTPYFDFCLSSYLFLSSISFTLTKFMVSASLTCTPRMTSRRMFQLQKASTYISVSWAG